MINRYIAAILMHDYCLLMNTVSIFISIYAIRMETFT